MQFAGPSIAGILITGLVSGRADLRELDSRLIPWRVGARWYAAALLPGPLLVAAVLFALSLSSPVFLPGIVTTGERVALLLFGLAWGLIGGGLLEELGWTGFAVPRLRLRYDALATGLFVGLLWGAWHFLIAFWASSALAGPISQTVSEASAVGAPTRPLWMLLGSLYDALVVGFGMLGWGVAICLDAPT